MKTHLIFFFYFLLVVGCQPSNELNYALEKAGENREELEKLLNYYPRNTLKHSAASFLVENLPHHLSWEGDLITEYRDSLLEAQKSSEQNRIWQHLISCKIDDIDLSYDINKITAKYLIQEIDAAFSAWEAAPWHSKISFDQFCRYILPYKILDEPIVEWRSRLRKEYFPLIKDANDPYEAFNIVYKEIRRKFRLGKVKYPYTRDAIMLDVSLRGECPARSRYIVFVMRSLAIPAVYDYTPRWANYSDVGHAWVSYVDEREKTYTVEALKNSRPKEFAHIDGTIEPIIDPHSLEQYPYIVDSVKKIAKIYRASYKITQRPITSFLRDTPTPLNDIHCFDVTQYYTRQPLSFSISLNRIINKKIYMCTYSQQDGWIPVGTESRRDNKEIYFDNIYDEVVCLPTIFDSNDLIPVTNPVIVRRTGAPHVLNPDSSSLRRITLKRKYLLLSRWYNRWNHLLGARFETSAERNFSRINNIKLVHEIKTTPVEENYIDVTSSSKDRYLRLRWLPNRFPGIAKIAFYYKDEGDQIKEIPFQCYLDNESTHNNTMQYIQDENLRTFFLDRKTSWIGFDFGKNPPSRYRVYYHLWNDVNHIEPNNEYELFYYDYKWRSLGKKTADSNVLIYDAAPQNALFLLKNCTTGKEERIFTYENERQIWW